MTASEPSIRLPRALEDDACYAAVRTALAASTRRLWSGGALTAPVVPLTAALAAALRAAAGGMMLCRGLEGAEVELEAERRGLAASAPDDDALPHAPRVSRLFLASHDGAERMYRRLEHLVSLHAPRVLACVVDADGATLGAAVYGADAVAKVLLARRKEAVVAILRAIAVSPPPG